MQTTQSSTFNSWLAHLLDCKQSDIAALMSQTSAVEFLIAWSLFESKCFEGDFKAGKLDAFTKRFVANGGRALHKIDEPVAHFHARYQDASLRSGMAPHDKTPPRVAERWNSCLVRSVNELGVEDKAFIAAFVASRLRNNMFHGMKPVYDWLRSEPQIQIAISVLQLFVEFQEASEPTLVPVAQPDAPRPRRAG